MTTSEYLSGDFEENRDRVARRKRTKLPLTGATDAHLSVRDDGVLYARGSAASEHTLYAKAISEFHLKDIEFRILQHVVIEKTSPTEAVGVVFKVAGRVRVVEYSGISPELAERCDPADATPRSSSCVRAASPTTTSRSTSWSECASAVADLPYHAARKEIRHYDAQLGQSVMPDEPNGVRLEQFAFDVFPHSETTVSMPGTDDEMGLGNEDAAAVSNTVWTDVTHKLEKLRTDIVTVVPDSQLKSIITKKFRAQVPQIQQAFLVKIKELWPTKPPEPEPVPEGSGTLVEVNTRDIRQNLIDELVDSLDTLVKIAKDSQGKPEFIQLLNDKFDFLSKKVEASVDGFEGNFASRYQKQAGTKVFGPFDFNRESLESDTVVPEGHTQDIPPSNYDKLQGEIGTLELKVASLEKQLKEARDEAMDKNKRIVELNGYLRLCDSLSTDHFECQRRISELEAQLSYKDVELDAEVNRVKLLSQTIKDLRDQLDKKDADGGNRPPLDARLQQLGFVNGSAEDVGSSDTAATTNRTP